MNANAKRRAKNGLIVGAILGLAISAVFWMATYSLVYWAFVPIGAALGAAQGYMAPGSE